MDKLLLSSLFALLAGFLTAALSYVKLVNDKENRVTDYRQEWTNSVRKSLSDIVARVRSLVDLISERSRRADICGELEDLLGDTSQNETEIQRIQSLITYQRNVLETINSEILKIRTDIYTAYHLAQLHFKIDEDKFQQVESKFTEVLSHLNFLIDDDQGEGNAIKKAEERIETLCNEIVMLSRMLLKTEWEIIKSGETTYRLSRKFSVWGGGIFFSVFLILSTITLANYSHNEKFATLSPESSSESAQNQISTRTMDSNFESVKQSPPLIGNVYNTCNYSLDEYNVRRTDLNNRSVQKIDKKRERQDNNAGIAPHEPCTSIKK